ncbi:MAG: hypothetical protein IJX80_05415 [Clostridia bacterium]|nr:hypothetical protein [Clostridia bacterium]
MVSARGIDYGYFWIELRGDTDDIITDFENIRDNLVAALYGVWNHNKNGGDPCLVNRGYSRKMDGIWNAWVSDGISELGETLTMQLAEASELSELRLTCWSDFRYPIRVTMAPNRQKQQRVGVPAESVKDYTVRLMHEGRTVREIAVKGNHQRLNVLKFEKTMCDSAQIVVHTTNRHENAVIFEVRAY